jgi:hypothetical protein
VKKTTGSLIGATFAVLASLPFGPIAVSDEPSRSFRKTRPKPGPPVDSTPESKRARRRRLAKEAKR